MLTYRVLDEELHYQEKALATMKEMGLSSLSIYLMTLFYSIAAFVISFPMVFVIYSMIADATAMVMSLSLLRISAVFILAIVMTAIVFLYVKERVKQIDPVDLYQS